MRPNPEWKIPIDLKSKPSLKLVSGKPKKALSPLVHGPLYSAKKAAEYLSVCVRTLYRLIKAGKLRRLQGTSKMLIPKSELDRFIGANV